MLQGSLIQNMRTRPDVFGSRQVAPLPPQTVPLYTLPPIVGNTTYSPMRGESLGTQFLRQKLEKLLPVSVQFLSKDWANCVR